MKKNMLTMDLKNQVVRTWDDGIQEYIISCKARNLASRTIDYYIKSSNRFIKHTNVIFINEVTNQVINYYILELKKTQNVNTINSYLRGIRTILHFFMELGYLHKFKIQMLKKPETIKETYTDFELKLLLKKPNLKKCSFVEYRDWVIINFFMGTGCRIGTLRHVLIRDIDLENSNIYLTTTKNKRQQIIPASSSLVKVLIEYIKYRKPQSMDDYLFCTIYGTQLQQRSLQQSIQKYNAKRGITKSSVHLFRHTFAKNWILAGGDIFRLQKILGHSSLDIVRNYVNMYGDDLKDNFDKFNPLEKFSSTNMVIKIR